MISMKHQSTVLLAPGNISETPGRNLLQLIRRCDKVSSSEDKFQIDRDILEQLHVLKVFIERSGLLTLEAVEKIKAQTDSSNSNVTAGSEGGKKRKRKGGDRGNSIAAAQYGIHLDSHSENVDKIDLEEGRIVMALCRILDVGKKNKEEEEVEGKFDASDELKKVGAACQVITSICSHSNNADKDDTSIVKDMMGSIAVLLLDGLCGVISKLEGTEKEGITTADTLISALKASASVISLVERRCSNSKAGEKMLQNLRTVAWSVLASTRDVEVLKAAATLLATLPLAGDSNNCSLSMLWTKSTLEGISLLQYAVDDFFPVSEERTGANMKQETCFNDHKEWMKRLQDTTDETTDNETIDDNRRNMFLLRVQSLTNYIISLIKMDGYSIDHDIDNILFVNFPIQFLLDISESLLSFPLVAEIKTRSIPIRLRSSPVEGGLISANAAIFIAASIRYCGHLLFDAAVSSCRRGAQSKARRIIAISMANLQSSVSRELLAVVVEGRRVEGRKDGVTTQLRGSIPLRIKSIEMFRTVVSSLGSGLMSSSATSKSVCKGSVLVGGCLLEQVQRCCATSNRNEEEWGTLDERANLVNMCSNTLDACISTLGGLIPNHVRGTIDSIIYTCLSTLYSTGSSSIFAYPHVKQSLLRLGMDSVCMAWGDGGRSTLLGIVRTVASMLRSDSDVSVVSAALSTRCALDAMVTPRAPALLIPSRETVIDRSDTLSANDIIERIKTVTPDETPKSETKQSKKRKANKKEQQVKVTDLPTSNNNKDQVLPQNQQHDDQAPTSVVTRSTDNKAVMNTETDRKIEVTTTMNDKHMSVKQSNEKTSNHETEAAQAVKTPALGSSFNPQSTDKSIDDNSSMSDFPEIIDEDPDEEDRV